MSQRRQTECKVEIEFHNRFRIPSARLGGWDYVRDGFYFVTICVKNRLPCLAEIIEGRVRLSSIGEIIAEEWEKTTEIRKNVKFDVWVIMPDHVHGIIGIIQSDMMNPETPRAGKRRDAPAGKCRDAPAGKCSRDARVEKRRDARVEKRRDAPAGRLYADRRRMCGMETQFVGIDHRTIQIKNNQTHSSGGVL